MQLRYKTGELVEPRRIESPADMSEEFADIKKSALSGLMTFVITSLLYALAAWFLIRLMNDNDVITWRLSWTEVSSAVLTLQFIRVWDKTFMR
jgi:hypothetical protein